MYALRTDLSILTCTIDDPITTLVKGSTLGKQLQSDACMAVASRWLEECMLQSGLAHKNCPKVTLYLMPSRVINVGPADGSKEPYLQDTKGSTGQWVVLSHCWGSTVAMTTTKATLQLRQEKIPLSALPRSFQDAVVITRKLGFVHLWIDSLCIIQDSVDDWNVESGFMGHIYSKAVVCIAAEAALNSSLGVFESSRKGTAARMVEGRYISPSTGLSGSLWFQGKSLDNSKSESLLSMGGPLSQRAWTLQENFLAPRIIRYGKMQLGWSCRSFRCSEHHPHFREKCDEPKKLFHFAETRESKELEIIKDYDEMVQLEWILECWYKFVNEYMARRLTNEDDRLPAIAGLAKEIGSRTGHSYRAGLWLEDIHIGLLWSTRGRAKYGGQYAAPSWSWASVSGFDVAPVYKLEHANHDLSTEWSANNISVFYSSKARVVDIMIEAATSDSFLKVNSATLVLFGLVYPFDDLLRASQPTFQQVSFKRSKKLRGSVTFCELDHHKEDLWTVSDLQNSGIIYLQITKTWHRPGEYEILWALILEPTDGAANQYRRIGIAEICPGDSMFKGWTEREIQIV